jgi:hypothetical protein
MSVKKTCTAKQTCHVSPDAVILLCICHVLGCGGAHQVKENGDKLV